MKKIFFSFFILFISFSCSSVRLNDNGCDKINSSNYFIEKVINKKQINNISENDRIELKQQLISQISSSVRKESKVFYAIEGDNANESFGEDVSIISYGYLNDPEITYCKKNKNYIVVLSINKQDFVNQTINQLDNELDVNLRIISSALRNFDSFKESFNRQEAKKFNIKSQQLESMHSLVVNENNYSLVEINMLNDKLAQYSAMSAEFAKLSYVFDKQKNNINRKIRAGLFKEAYIDLNILLKTYGDKTNEAVEISSILDGLLFKIEQEWNNQNMIFNEHIRDNLVIKAKVRLDNLFNLIISEDYQSKYNNRKDIWREKRRKIERESLLKKSPKNQEFFFGLNATSSFGNINSTDEQIFLDPETSNFNFDKILPSYKFGYRFNFNPKKRLGVFFQYKVNSSKFIDLGSDESSDYQFPFSTDFNEIQVGFSAGAFDFSYGKLLDPMDVNNQQIDFNTASINLSLITTDGRPKGEKNYFNLYGGINLISDFDELSYLNILIGLNYHIRFNRKLAKSDRNYLSNL